jgi:hypothetical protein
MTSLTYVSQTNQCHMRIQSVWLHILVQLFNLFQN